MYGLFASICAGVFTALLVAALHPSAAVWVAVWIALTVALGAFQMRRQAPEWFAWACGRDPRRSHSS
jgi:hypothetical protein